MTPPARQTLILGAGGHARVCLAAYDQPIAGCIAPSPPAEGWPGDVPYLGADDALDGFDPGRTGLINGLGSIGTTALRRRVFDDARAKGFGFVQVIDPRATLIAPVRIGEGVQILACAVVQPGAQIGQNVIINTGAVVDHDARIGDHVHVAPGATLSGGVKISAGAHIGTGAVIIQGIHIGAGAIIGAGAVVIRDIEPGTTVVGNPAKPLIKS